MFPENSNIQLVYFVNRLNSLFDHFWWQHPLVWNNSLKTWYFERNKARIYFCSTIGFKTFIVLTNAVSFIVSVRNPDDFSQLQITGYAFCAVGYTCTTALDCIAFMDGQQLLIVTNWVYHKNSWIYRYGKLKSKISPNSNLIRNLVFFAGAPNFYKFMGLGGTILTVAFTVVIGLFSAALYMFEMDAWSLIFHKLNCDNSNLLQLLRLFVILYSMYIGIIVFRVMLILGLTEILTRIALLQIVCKVPLSLDGMRLYQESMVAMRIVRKCETFAMALILTGMFALILICFNGFLIFAEDQQLGLAGFCVVFIFYCCVILEIFFKAGALMLEFSQGTLFKWENVCQENTGMSKVLYKRVLKRMHKITLPAGNVGVVDRDIKSNYYECLLNYIINIVITRNSM